MNIVNDLQRARPAKVLTAADLPPAPAGKSGWPWTEGSPALPERMESGAPWPSFSIVTPSYNQAEFLEETIRSVLLQGYPGLEYRVIDGGSRDGSVEIIEKYAPWLDSWVSEPDRGQSHAINKGWAASSGELIAYLNSDDTYAPGALAAVARAWNWDPRVAMIVGAAAFTGEDVRGPRRKAPLLKAASPLDLSLLEPSDWYLPQQSTFFLKTALDRAGRYLREELHYTMDRELLYRICRQGVVLLIPDCISTDRRHGASKRSSQTLAMYREDAAALAFCSWGGPKEAIRRRAVARRRMAQGYYLAAALNPSSLQRLRYYLRAAWYRPHYLRSRSFYQTVLRSLRLIGDRFHSP